MSSAPLLAEMIQIRSIIGDKYVNNVGLVGLAGQIAEFLVGNEKHQMDHTDKN